MFFNKKIWDDFEKEAEKWKKEEEENMNKDFDYTISELRKEIQYIKDRYNAPVEVIEELVSKINEKLFLYDGAYEEQKNCNEYLKNELKRKVIPAQMNPNTIRWVYKESYETGKKVKVGVLDTYDSIVLAPPKDITIYSPTLYSTIWYVEPRGYEGTDQYLGFESKNTINEIVVKRKELGLVDKVTGYITEEGKAIYYDQYNW